VQFSGSCISRVRLVESDSSSAVETVSGFRSGVGLVAFCWFFLLCRGDFQRNCLVDWLSYWLDWFAKRVECSLAVNVSLDPLIEAWWRN
jgi:hypothetical protein